MELAEGPWVPLSAKSGEEDIWEARRRAAWPELEKLLQSLLATLDQRGRPGLQRIGPFKRRALGKGYVPTGPYGYETFVASVFKGWERGERFTPTVKHFVTPAGDFFELDGTPTTRDDLDRHVAGLYFLLSQAGVNLPISTAVAQHPNWNTHRYPASS